MKLGLRAEVLIAFALVTIFAIGLNTIVVWNLELLVLRRERMEQTASLARLAGRALADEADPARLLRDVPGMRGAIVYDIAGAERSRAGEPGEVAIDEVSAAMRLDEVRVRPLLRTGDRELMRAAAPIGEPSRGAVVLWVTVGPPPGASAQARRVVFLYIAFNAIVVGFFGWHMLSRAVLKPVSRLAEATRRVASGDLETRVFAARNDEIGDLARDFNRMTEALREKEAALAKQLRELKSAREEVVQSEKLASVGRLAAGVAHELGNPVGAVTGYVSLLRRGARDKEDEEILARIEREMQRVDRIIRDLLDYSRPRPQAAAPIDPNAVVEGALAIVSVQKGFKAVTLEKKLGDVPKVNGDAHRLQQVLVNLLINAADAVESAPVKVVSVETALAEFPVVAADGGRRRHDDDPYPAGPAVAIRVRDTGTGIAPEHLPLVFDPFFTTKEPGRGTGLGLAIARPIVQSMGGRLLVESEKGAGTTFSVLLPPLR